ncbi:MAG: aminotransferase class III-fold pyridoxal phosphate-dependent enzyme [Flavobacteriaceae bacterium]|nr:aminotransferase class III-fold pyridoxal phosphate-dependent enzyme [Flavobacteriaceae bacterium]MCI5088108.1 aminotransferase class III-fold pyridoxal phosphate-dependent enzyme [Flavobacteriaceae bacterium]
MKLFDVYPLYDISPVAANGSVITDEKGQEYLDLYGGHAVISIGHNHPHYSSALKDQLDKISFYSNAVQNPVQKAYAKKLGAISGCDDYQLFLCNSGAEANENAIKLASFISGKSKLIAFRNSFHGRTSAAVAATDNPAIQAPINRGHEVLFLDFEDEKSLEAALQTGTYCGVIIEPIQGVGGLDQPSTSFFKCIERLCHKHVALLIADEVQSGFGRSGHFFGFQHHGVVPDLIPMAKGMGNGFPIGGLLVHPKYKGSHGQLGTTFGGNHLACRAGLAVLEVIETEGLVKKAAEMETYVRSKMASLPADIRLKGRGLMLGLSFPFEVGNLRKELLYNHHIFTGAAKDKKVLRILPALNIKKEQIDLFFEALKEALKTLKP